ncbi:PX domain-containing protein EREX, partial [Carica papaya]|uniref:PX domain-containing protein EREX n=1 Tax=Carica papaya TaxID=3649 RepID=UPI000B8CD540
FYRVRVGIQSPEGITTTRCTLRRYSDFLKLLSELKKEFPKKALPVAPAKRILRIKSKRLLEERRCCLEDWMGQLLSDIDISRSTPVAMFLELEAAARSSFDDVDQQITEANSSSSVVTPFLFDASSDVSLVAGSASVASDHDNGSSSDITELGMPRLGKGNDILVEDSTCEQKLTDKNYNLGKLERVSRQKMQTGGDIRTIVGKELSERIVEALRSDRTEPLTEVEHQRLDDHAQRFSMESIRSDLSSARASEASNIPEGVEASTSMDAPFNACLQSADLIVALPSDERHKFNRILKTMQQRLATAKTDMEDLIARLNQEITVRQFLTTKVKDLEVELDTTRENCKENIQQAALIEKEKFTQAQWDMEELRKQCLEMELTLKSVQDEKARIELAKLSLLQENNTLLQELNIVREQLGNLHKGHEELEVKSKADVKVLVKEVKSLRSSQSELKKELSSLMKEKLELERVLQKEKQKTEHTDTANAKLLHECEILWNRLQECSVNFLVEEEDKLTVETSSPSDAIDLLVTSDNRIGLLLAEAQLLAQDVEVSGRRLDETENVDGNIRRTKDELKKMLTDILVDNARLRKQMNSVLRCTLNPYVKSDKEDEDEEEETNLRKTVLNKFLER